jgi:hypothetical protein
MRGILGGDGEVVNNGDRANHRKNRAFTIFNEWPGRSSNTRVERGPSEGARSASRRTTRLPVLGLFDSVDFCGQTDNPHGINRGDVGRRGDLVCRGLWV